MRVWCWPRNTPDFSVLPEVRDKDAGKETGPGDHRGRPGVLGPCEPGLPS